MQHALRSLCPDAIFTGTLAPDAVAVAMASADLFVFPSRTDTAGNVVLEAQASGLPVLVSDAGGPRENILAGDSGYICRAFEDFAARTDELLRQAPRRATMGIAARQYALTRRWESALEPLYRAYGETRHAPAAFRPAVDDATAAPPSESRSPA
jgi:glycosyltransferase involved in cell wall biosynthesis